MRPLLQDVRLTAWELNQAGIPVTPRQLIAGIVTEGDIQPVREQNIRAQLEAG